MWNEDEKRNILDRNLMLILAFVGIRVIFFFFMREHAVQSADMLWRSEV